MAVKVHVLGGAQTDFERNWKKENKNMIALLKEVLDDALAVAGISYGDISELNKKNRVACFVGNFIGEMYVNQGHLGALLTEVNDAFYGVPSARYEAACASGSAALDAAMTKIESGTYDVAVVIGWEMMKTVDAKICGDILGRAAFYEKEAKNVEYPFPKLFGRLADELLCKYPNVGEERFFNALAKISAINYANAKRNPLAQTRKWFMDVEQARMRGTATNPFVGGRLANSDCSQITDGAAVVFLVSEHFLKERFPERKVPYIKGFGHRVAPMIFEEKLKDGMRSEYILPWTRQTVLDAYERAGLTVKDIDVFETHDCFTSSEYMAISSFGITAPGEEYTAVEDGVIDFDGKYPINPSGGLIGCGHPVGASGVRMMLDLYKQVSNTAGTYQIDGANNAIMLNFGGTATTNYAFILGNDK